MEVFIIAHVDIENSRTQKVITLDLPIIEHIENKLIKFDISKLTEQGLSILNIAISERKELSYSDIEMFFIDNDEVPYFGPDYNFFV